MSATLVACLTPPGRGAIATVALRGPDAWAITRQLFRGALPTEPPAGRFWVGKLGDEMQDDVVLAVRRGLPEPSVEIHCHGGPEVVRLLVESFARHGATPCSWQDFAAPDDIRPLLANAPTTRTATILLDQHGGAFRKAADAVCAALERDDIPQALALLNRLARLVAIGAHLAAPWRVVLAGAPNVGKSSLVNALAGYTRSVVAPSPGTTRDVVSVQIAIDGWPVELIDTAGLRDAAADLEAAGIERARTALADADVRLWVVDGSATPVWPDAETGPALIVINKADLPAAWPHSDALDAVRVSALSGAGLDELCAVLSRRLVPEPPLPGEGVPVTTRQAAAVRAACAQFAAGDYEGVPTTLIS